MTSLLLVNAGQEYQWSELLFVDRETYSIDIYVCEVLAGTRKGEKVRVADYYNIIKCENRKDN